MSDTELLGQKVKVRETESLRYLVELVGRARRHMHAHEGQAVGGGAGGGGGEVIHEVHHPEVCLDQAASGIRD